MSRNFVIKIGAAQLKGEQAGLGSTLVFLDAGVSDRRMWANQLNHFSDHYYVVSYDMRGFGETTSPDERYSNVEDLLRVLDELNILRATLVACSQGGRLAIDFALVYMDRVAALVLVSTAISGAPSFDDFAPNIQARIDALDEADEDGDLDRVNELEAILWLDGPDSRAHRVKGRIRELFLDMNGIALRMPELSRQVEPLPAYERLSEISLHVLVVSGELNFLHIQQRSKYAAHKFPNAEFVQLRGTAHLPSLEDPDAFNRVLQGFLAKQEGVS